MMRNESSYWLIWSDMSEIVEEMLQNAIKALNTRDIPLAKQVINSDDVLDNYQITIEEEVSRLLVMNQPLKSDVWNNIAAVKIAGDQLFRNMKESQALKKHSPSKSHHLR